MIGKVVFAAAFAAYGAISLLAAAQDDACGTLSVCVAASDDQNPASAQQPAAQQPVTPPAAAATPQTPAAGTPPAPKKPDLGPWWTKSSFAYKPMPEQWLFHADGTFSYMDGQGNVSGASLDISGSAELRKKRFTSHTFAQLSRKDLTYATTRSQVNYDERTLREQGDYDLTSYLTLVGGVEDYRNTLMFMDKRLNVYGGLGSTLYSSKKHSLYLMAAAGHADFVFERAELLAINPREVGLINTSPSSAGVLGQQFWRWTVSPKFNFTEGASYMKYDVTSLGHRWTINLNANFPITKWFSFNTSYAVKEETNVIIQALHVFPQDRTFLMGIRLSI